MGKKKIIATNLRSIIITKCTMFSRGWDGKIKHGLVFFIYKISDKDYMNVS